jgi:hypothetical protein
MDRQFEQMSLQVRHVSWSDPQISHSSPPVVASDARDDGLVV